MTKHEEKCFAQGVFYAASTLVALFDTGAAERLITESGYEWNDVKKSGISPYDVSKLQQIKGAFADQRKLQDGVNAETQKEG